MAIGERIYRLRSYKGITQKVLGEPDYSIGYVSKVEHQQISPSDHFIQLASEKLRVNKKLLIWTPKEGEALIQSMVQRIRKESRLSEEEKNALYLLSYEKLSDNLLLSIFMILIKESKEHQTPDKTFALVNRSLGIFGGEEDQTYAKVDKEDLIDYFILCGNCYFEKQDFYRAEILYTKAERFLAEETSLQAARLYYNLSLVKQRITGHYDLALRYADKSLRAFRVNHAENDVYDVYITKGVLFHLGGKYEESLQCLENAKNYFEKKQDFFKLQMIYYNKGRAYQGMGDDGNAILYLNRSLSLQERLENTSAKAYVYRELGEIYVKNGQLRQAEEWINSGLYLSIQHRQTYLECEFRELKARLLWMNGHVKEYVKVIESVIQDAIHYHYNRLAARISYSYATILYQKGKFKQASEYFRKAYLLVEKGGRENEEGDTHYRCIR